MLTSTSNSSNINTRFSLTEQCIIFPKRLYDVVMEKLDLNCDTGWYFCEVASPYSSTNVSRTVLSFKLSQDGPLLHINIANMLILLNGKIIVRF